MNILSALALLAFLIVSIFGGMYVLIAYNLIMYVPLGMLFIMLAIYCLLLITSKEE